MSKAVMKLVTRQVAELMKMKKADDYASDASDSTTDMHVTGNRTNKALARRKAKKSSITTNVSTIVTIGNVTISENHTNLDLHVSAALA